MSKTWYPVIDYVKCTECGLCVKKCKNGVYNKEKAPTPVVVFQEGCIQGCHGCGNICPSKAISYVGDKVKSSKDCGCTSEKGNGGSCCG